MDPDDPDAAPEEKGTRRSSRHAKVEPPPKPAPTKAELANERLALKLRDARTLAKVVDETAFVRKGGYALTSPNLALALARAGALEDAIAEFRSAIEVDDRNADLQVRGVRGAWGAEGDGARALSRRGEGRVGAGASLRSLALTRLHAASSCFPSATDLAV